ncbi:MAG: M20/M25/M40 family metallo-hydrolase [Candidatus Acidiferrales bacterium]
MKSLFLCGAILLCLSVSVPVARPQSPTSPKAPWDKQTQTQAGCSVEKTCADVAPGMIRNALGPSPLEENLRYLTDVIGGRVSASPAASRAVKWAVEAFRRARVDDVHTEKFTIPVGWGEGRTRVEVLEPEPFPVRLVSTGWSPPTPEGGLTADVVDVGEGTAADFARAGNAARGAIVLVHQKVIVTWEDLFNEYMTGPAIVDRAVNSGAAAIFWMASRERLLLYRHILSLDGTLEKLPQAIVAREDALRMARFLATGTKVRVHFDMPNRVSSPVESENVVAEIRGREKPDEYVILAAHLDSWELGTGALDNSCNAAMVIDAARVIRESGVIPRRSIRFILFTGEEQGMLGSEAYARAHRAELDNAVAVIVFDAGTGRVTGYSLGGRKELTAAIGEVLEPAKSLGPFEQTADAVLGTDNFDFLLEGVPTLVANQEPANYMQNYHAASDTFDKVDIAQLKKHVALVAITAFGIADDPARIGRRQTRAEIEQLMKESGLDEQMRLSGLWLAWESGQRGRQP